MKSRHPKVLSEVLFKPMISWVTGCCAQAGLTRGAAVLGNGADEVAALLPETFTTVIQAERLGTGHAASMAQDFLRAGGFSHALVLNGDAPFLDSGDLRAAYEQHTGSGNLVTVISAEIENPFGYGRILREGEAVVGIVEQKDADEAQQAIREVNSGAYWFEAAFLLDYFAGMQCANAQGEYYLTDTVACAVGKGGKVGAHSASPLSVLGANDRVQLRFLNQTANSRTLHKHMMNGVNIPFADGVVIGPDVEIGPDTTILPGTILKGSTKVGADCEIGPNSYLIDAVVGDSCTVTSSQIEKSTLEDRVRIGPMSNIRPSCYVAAGAKVGDFVELKNSQVGAGTSVAHLTYIGDSDVGSGCNFGCGVVTVNYDGSGKYRTTVGDNAFIGCNVNLVAPVEVGDRVYAAAGTTITDNVPADALVIGRARQVVKENWVQERGRYTRYKKK